MLSPLQCVQKIYEAFHELDFEGVYAQLHDDVSCTGTWLRSRFTGSRR